LLRRERRRHAVHKLRRPLRKQHVRGQQHVPLLHHVQGGRALRCFAAGFNSHGPNKSNINQLFHTYYQLSVKGANSE